MAFNYEIKERIAILSESADGKYTTEINIISYNGAPAKMDIRKWNRMDDRMGKGIALNEDEATALVNALLDRKKAK